MADTATTASAAAASAANTSTDAPPFQLGKPRFQQTSFYGRLRHFLDIIDPRTLFVTERRLREAVQLLEDYKHGTLHPGVTNEQLWSAQKIKQAILHPDTNEKIFMPFRMSGYIPFGTPIFGVHNRQCCFELECRNPLGDIFPHLSWIILQG